MDPTTQQSKLLKHHLSLVIAYNEQLNLTRIVSPDQAHILHIEDSLAGVDAITRAPEGPLVDLGSGAGYPGIPLAIMLERNVTLVESVAKKAQALTSMVETLELDWVDVFTGRAEELALQKAGEYSVVTARALTQLPSLLELASPLLAPHGWLCAYKAEDIEEELEHACSIARKLGMSYCETVHLTLSDNTPRTLVVFEKQHEPEVKLPRRAGMAQKRPYRA